MKLNKGENIQKKVIGSVRRTQIITTFGPGSIVNINGHSFILAGTDFWKNSEGEKYHIYEENLQKQLGVDYFIQPKYSDDEKYFYKKSEDIPAFVFPKTLICSNPKCGKIANYNSYKKGKKIKCPNCGSENIVPSRFIMVCENGHIDDFDYSLWVHGKQDNNCKNKRDLVMYNDKKSGGLESIVIRCKSCGKSRSMKNAFGKEFKYKCKAKRPWLNDVDPDGCNCKSMKVSQRGSSNVYFAIHESALSIPPWSKRIQQEISKNDRWQALKSFIDNDENLRKLIRSFKLCEKCDLTEDEVIDQIKIKNQYINGDIKVTRESIRQDEYQAFTRTLNDDNGEFQIEESPVPNFLNKYVEKVVIAKRLREVLALTDFNRLNSNNENSDGINKSKLSSKRLNWFPAIELRGEGIFIKLNEEKVRKWESRPDVIERYKHIEINMEKSIFKIKNLSPRYILLHTLSHLIIKQLILQCGYSTSALKERIYSTFDKRYVENVQDMCGILIYTATSDSEGSLGGVVSQGNPEKLENTFRSLLENASWCSSDPLCIQSSGQGFDNLNLAACYACTLLPETSCEQRNCYLDRAALIGSFENKDLGYFNELLC